ncbi:hypothetical protein LTR53_005240 [Teratosphaeriaceae sp. CCFEE 6253]|nr:hypothetical protein LTR53_005240 [Teratosphaeriaceae sp. CCFEE 6253]
MDYGAVVYYLCFSLIAVTLLLLGLITVAVGIQISRVSDVPADIPWVGLDNRRWFPRLRATLTEVTAGRKRFEEGHEKYSTHDLPFILPSLQWPEIILPPSNASWIASQPESVLSMHAVFDAATGLEYFGHGPDLDYAHDFAVISRDLTRNLIKTLPDVLQEIEASFTDLLADVGADEWKEVDLMNYLAKTAHRAAAAMFVGKTLCRDPKYLLLVRSWIGCFGLSSAVFRMLVPQIFQPVVGRLLALPMAVVKWLAVRRLLPTLRQRLARVRDAQRSEKPASEDAKPNDLMQWIVDDAARKRDVHALKPWDLAGKVLLIELLAYVTTTLTIHRILVDILTHPDATALLLELRQEADALFPELASNPTAVRSMTLADSCIRETTRINAIAAHGLQRQIVQPGGVTTPNGLHLPRGAHVATLMPDLFDRETRYDPRRALLHHSASGKQKMAVDISEHSLAFGRGKHACPGRFFAVQNIKLMLGWLVRRYDFQPLSEPIKFTMIGEVELIPKQTRIKMRRRKMEDAEGEESL